MVSSIPITQMGRTINEVQDMLLKQSSTFDVIDYVYVVDSDNKLQGVISIKEVLGASNKEVKVEEMMKKELIVAHPFTKQERIVYLALSHNIKDVPVVDKIGRILGVIPFDAILNTFHEEIRHDILSFGGIFHRVGKEFSTVRSPASVMFKKRLPWLIIGVIGGTFTASVVSVFESTLDALISLVAFIPVIAFLSDAAGTQSETLAVRSLALEPKLSRKAYFLRENQVALSLASTCGFLVAITALVGWSSPRLSLIVGLSMFLGILIAVFISTSLPFLLARLDLDPAFASGPFATMISDMVTIVVYLFVASQIIMQSAW